VFAAMTPASRPQEVRLEVSEPLSARGFDAPAVKDGTVFGTADAWTVVSAVVEVDPKGVVRHVFLETSSGRTDVDQAIVKGLYRGRCAQTGSVCEGRVSIVFPGRDAAAPKL
jgi:hypothetical protein